MTGLQIFISVSVPVLSSVVYGNNDDWKVKMEQKLEHVLGVLENQRSEISMLKHKIILLEKTCKQPVNTDRPETEVKPNGNIGTIKTAETGVYKPSLVHSTGINKSQKRLLLSGVEIPVVAFYAYISKDFSSVGKGHVYIFDSVVTNQGNAYNNNSGAFTAPASGIFAFAWTAYASGEHVAGDTSPYYGEVSVHLVQNSQYRGSIYVDTETNYEEEMATGFAILHLQAGDVVMVTSPSAGQGSFHSNPSGRWSFSGFQIS